MDLPSESIEPLSLLYVEDQYDSRILLSSMIETKFPAMKLYTAENGKGGLASYSERHSDILLTDISMPHINGIQMARNIKKLNNDVMIIVLTARTDTQYLLESIDIGISQYVLKPIDHHLLFAAINKCIDAITMRQTVKKQYDRITQLNASLLARTNELETLNREIEAFNYTVSHDLRTPLTVIHGFCQVLLEMCDSKMGLPRIRQRNPERCSSHEKPHLHASEFLKDQSH